MEMDGSRQVFLTLTRCRSEQITTGNMQGMSIKYVNSFQGSVPGSLDSSEGGQSEGEQAEDGQPQYGQVHYAQPSSEKFLKDTAPHQTYPAPEPSTPTGTCGYCDQERALLNVPGFYICQVCAQIELGRAGANTGNTEMSDDSPPAK
jgi:hypothetical protein